MRVSAESSRCGTLTPMSTRTMASSGAHTNGALMVFTRDSRPKVRTGSKGHHDGLQYGICHRVAKKESAQEQHDDVEANYADQQGQKERPLLQQLCAWRAHRSDKQAGG